MSVYLKGKIYHYDFEKFGQQFRKSTRCKNKRDAEEVERQRKAEVVAEHERLKRLGGKGPLMWIDAAQFYWEQVGQYQPNHKGTYHGIAICTQYFGKTKRLDEINLADLYGLRDWRRKHTVKDRGLKVISNATVNRTGVEIVRKVFRHAQELGYQFPHEPNWGKAMLEEAGERVRELTVTEEGQLFDTVRPDYEPWLRFALTTGLRLKETILKWSNVHWDAGLITSLGKGGRTVKTPLNAALRELLEPLKGHDPVWVFTYQAKRASKGRGVAKGARLPLTYSGIKSEWQAHRKRHGVAGFRIHDTKHDTLSKVNRIAGLKIASRAGNHSDTNTTGKYYAHAHDYEVADALQRVAEARVPKKVPKIAN